MNLTKFKEKRIQKSFSKKLYQQKNIVVNSNKMIQSVGIVTTDAIASSIDLQNDLETILGVRNSKLYSFRKFNKLNEESFKHFSEKDINWKGEFIQPNFTSFLEQPLDLLIGYFNTNHLYLECAVLESNASFKVGFSGINTELYQLEIAEEAAQSHQFFSELKKYLVILKKLKN